MSSLKFIEDAQSSLFPQSSFCPRVDLGRKTEAPSTAFFGRALVADPRIVVLDEATANIDSYTEMLIQRALQKLLEGRTAIIIAHRLSTVRGADKIVVLRYGEVVEIGPHAELMQRDGLYAHLYRMNHAALEGAATPALSGNGNGANDKMLSQVAEV